MKAKGKPTQRQRIMRWARAEQKRLGLEKCNSLIEIAINLAIARGDKPNLSTKGFAREYLTKLQNEALGPPPASPCKKKATPKLADPVDVKSDDFLSTYAWRKVRMQAIKRYGARCMCCGATPDDGVVMNVDHIQPRKLYPDRALDIENLQILCNPCNHGKGNWDQTDWRPKAEVYPNW